MRNTGRLALIAGFACALCVAPRVTDASGVADAEFVPGDKLQGSIDYSGDADEATFDALRGMKLKVAVSPSPGAGLARAEVLDQWRKSLGPKGRQKAGKAGSVTLKSSGAHALRISGGPSVSGGYEVTTSVVLPKTAKARTVKAKASKTLDATATVDLLRGAMLDAVITLSKEPTEVDFEAVSPTGEIVHLGAWMGMGEGGEWLLTGFPATSTGTWKLRVSGLVKKTTATFKLTPTQPAGAATKALLECVLPPADTPTTSTATYSVDPALNIGPGVGSVGVLTAIDSGPLGPLDGLVPDVTQILFLTDAQGAPFAPFVVRPADVGAPGVAVTELRIALGFVGLHPAVARLPAERRELFFDQAPNAASFPFLQTAVRLALAGDPAGLADPTKYPEIYRSADKAATETIALLGGAALKAAFHTPWGDYETPATFDVQGSTCGKAVLINPRHVFYGVEGVGPRGVRRVALVPPRDDTVTTWPWTPPDPLAVGVDVLVGRTDFTADALAASLDLDTPGGLGTTANALCAALHVFQLATPTRASPVETTERLVQQIADGQFPEDPDLAADLAAIDWNKTPSEILAQLEQFLSDNGGRNWKKLANALWQWNPTSFDAAHLAAARRFIGGYFVVGDIDDAMPFLAALSRVAGEPALQFSVTRTGLAVTPTGPPPFSFDADFTFAPTVPATGELVTFDPAASTFSATPPTAPTYRWTIYDAPDAPPTVVDRGADPTPATYAFTTEGFHLVVLEMAVGPDAARTFHVVQVQSSSNLGFEKGDMSDWNVWTYTWWSATQVLPGHSAIVQLGWDPNVPTLPTVFHGNYALRIEDDGVGGYISAAERTIQVPQDGMVLKFAWAAVLEDPQHAPSEQPYFDIKVRDVTTNEDLYVIHHYSNEPGFPWQTGGTWSDIKWVPWQPQTLDLSTRGGHVVVITAIAADCEPTGHYGYVYLDAP